MRFFLDNNLSHRVARALHCLAEPKHSVTHLRDRFALSTPDVEWMRALAGEEGWIILSADTAISRNPHEIAAWLEAGHPIFFFQKSWLQQLFWEQASRLCHLFPEIIRRAERAHVGDTFRVPFRGPIEDP
jgi:hypothetical protein